MLNSVHIRGFKSVGDAQLALSRVTVLVGPNNSGKSSVLQGIQFGVSIAQSLQLSKSRGWIKSKGERSGSLSTQQLVFTPLRDVDALATGGTLRTNSNEILVRFETDDFADVEVRVSKGKNKNIQVNVVGQTLGEQLQLLETPYSVLAPGLAGIPAIEPYQSAGPVRRAAARGDANSVFRNVLLSLKADSAAWGDFESAFAEVFPDVTIDVEFDDKSDEYISAWATRDGVRLPIESSGTGVLQAIQVLAYIGLYKPRVLILDEPDAHLHPDNQRKLARLLVRLAEEREFQVLISTHSRHMLDEMTGSTVVVHWMSGGAFQEGDFDRVRALLDLGALDAGDRLRNGATPVVVLTEDSDTAYLRAILASSGFRDGEFDLWSYAGSTEVPAARTLARFIAEHAPGTIVIVHRDRDYLSDDEVVTFEAEIAAAGATPFVTRGTDIESHFIQGPHLQVVFPELAEARVEELIQLATNASRGKSLEIMINARNAIDVRARAKESKPPNPGGVSTTATNDFDSATAKYRHGKKTLGALRKLIQDEEKLSRPVAVASPHLDESVLRAIADAIPAP